MDIQTNTPDTTASAATPGNVAAPQPTEAPKPPEAAPKQSEDVFSKQFLAIRTKEKELRAREQKASEILKRYQDFDALKRDAPLNPEAAEKALALLGLDYESLTELIAKGKAPEAVIQRQMQAELQKLRDELAEEKKQSQASEQQKQLKTYKSEVTAALKGQPDKFPLINALEHFETVVDAQIAKFDADSGEGPGWDEVAAEHEKYLEQEIIRAAQLPAIKKKIEALYNTKPPEETKPNTLTNDLNASPTKVAGKEDDLELAIRMLSQAKT